MKANKKLTKQKKEFTKNFKSLLRKNNLTPHKGERYKIFKESKLKKYVVSDCGRVFSWEYRTGEVIDISKTETVYNNNGYCRFEVSLGNSKRKKFLTHIAVADLFCNFTNKSLLDKDDRRIVHHKDFNHTNNNYYNLKILDTKEIHSIFYHSKQKNYFVELTENNIISVEDIDSFISAIWENCFKNESSQTKTDRGYIFTPNEIRTLLTEFLIANKQQTKKDSCIYARTRTINNIKYLLFDMQPPDT